MENKKNMDQVVGEAFEEMEVSEMENIQGAGDVEGEFTPITSSPGCATAISAIASAVSGVVVSLKKC